MWLKLGLPVFLRPLSLRSLLHWRGLLGYRLDSLSLNLIVLWHLCGVVSNRHGIPIDRCTRHVSEGCIRTPHRMPPCSLATDTSMLLRI